MLLTVVQHSIWPNGMLTYSVFRDFVIAWEISMKKMDIHSIKQSISASIRVVIGRRSDHEGRRFVTIFWSRSVAIGLYILRPAGLVWSDDTTPIANCPLLECARRSRRRQQFAAFDSACMLCERRWDTGHSIVHHVTCPRWGRANAQVSEIYVRFSSVSRSVTRMNVGDWPCRRELHSTALSNCWHQCMRGLCVSNVYVPTICRRSGVTWTLARCRV
jgi:hypothetical protein